MKVCLSLFTARGIVRYETGGRYRLLCPDMTRDELVRTGQSYRDRQERDLRKHQEPDERCGHCDHCKRWALQGGTRVGATAETGLAEKPGRTSSPNKKR